jgi:hypothetical protein
MNVEKADWMSEEGYRSAVERGAFRRAGSLDDLTRYQRAARGILGLATIAVALTVVATAIFGLGLTANALAHTSIPPWTVAWVEEAFKDGLLALVAIAVLAIFVYGAFLRAAWPAMVALGAWVLSRWRKSQ